MALVTCANCGKQVREQDPRCWSCGAAMSRGMAAESKHVTVFRQRHLKPGEKVLAHLEGYIGEMMGSGKNTQHNGALVVTDHRVVFYRKGILGEVLETLPIEKITSVERKTMLGHTTLRLHTSHDDLAFKTLLDAPRLEKAIAAIESRRDVAGHAKMPPPRTIPWILSRLYAG